MKEQIRQCIVSVTSAEGIERLGDSDSIFEGLITSLDFFKLIGCLEETFKISIKTEELTVENFSSVDVISGFLQREKGVEAHGGTAS
jgi:acyl carrier protein